VRGTVFEHLPVSPDVRPLAGGLLRIFNGAKTVEVISGADGSYEANVPDTAPFVSVVASGPWYFTPCPSFRSALAARIEEPLDVHVVSGAVLTATGQSNSYPMDWNRVIHGRVFERMSNGLVPVSGATVTLHSSERLQDPWAATITNERGGYSMCWVVDSQQVVEASKEGYAPASVPAITESGSIGETDLVLIRQ
jgi:hypothetical protein